MLITEPPGLLPSEVTDDYWVYADGPAAHGADASRTGKWLVFVPARQIDRWCEQIRLATEQGRLGISAKAALNRPVGSRRHFGVACADLAAVRTVGRNRGGTVNDVVLVAVSGALNSLLAHRGEHVDDVVVSVPVSGRSQAAAAQLGNQVGVIP